jgi:excisionase family DNA binding protein
MTNEELLAGGLEKVSQAAKRLGIDRNTLYAWIQEGKIAHTRINGVYRIPTLAVNELLLQGLKMGDVTTKRQTCTHKQQQKGTPHP